MERGKVNAPLGKLAAAPSVTTISLPDGSSIQLADWIDDKLYGIVQTEPPPPPWDDPCSWAGWIADLVLALPERTRDERRAARCILRLAKRRDFSKQSMQSAARAVQAVKAAESTHGSLKDALAALRSAATLARRLPAAVARLHMGRGPSIAATEEGVDVVRLEVRWRIRDWVGRVPVPPHVRQAAYAAWMARYYKSARKLVEDYVNDWLAKPVEP